MTRRLLALTLAAALLATACGGSDTAVEPRLRSLPAADFHEFVTDGPAGLVVLDIRTPAEYDEVHIAGAVNIDYYEPSFSADLDALDKDAPYAIYCRSGNRSGDTMQIMEGLGFTDVTELAGGVITWYDAGYPLEG
ncbi:MAG: rhodanese-like domain-containing protein [Actinobacteria bacterium]|nr:rhodanese-like domain-containing protein [Actinomycetota bacterium]